MSDRKPILLLIGYRAYGDWLYTVPVFKHLLEKYEIHLEINTKGFELLKDDPRFKSITMFEISAVPEKDREKVYKERIQFLIDKINPDKVIDIRGTLEQECIAEANQKIFYAPVAERRAQFGEKNFYKAIFEKCEISIGDKIDTEGLHFTEKEISWAENWRKKHIGDFIVMVPFAGSCAHKVFPCLLGVISKILEKYHNSCVYIAGDSSLNPVFSNCKHDRLIHAYNDVPIKQAVLMTKYADIVIGPETGVVVAAGMFGTHKIMLNTASSVSQCNDYQKNDHSIQAKVGCSPCHRAVYTEQDCENLTDYAGQKVPACTESIKADDIMPIVAEVYNKTQIYNKEYMLKYIKRAESEMGQRIYAERWKLVSKYVSEMKKSNMRKVSLLDYGCAQGHFLESKDKFIGMRLLGYDVNPYSRYNAYVANVDIDILTLWDVVEHIKKPEEIFNHYNPRFIFLSFPNIGEGKEKEWIHYRPDEHIHYFNLERMKKLLMSCGYKIIHYDTKEGFIRNPDKSSDILTVVAKKNI